MATTSPNYLDNAAVVRDVVQEKSATATQYLMEVEPRLFLTLGQVTFRASGDRAGVSDAKVRSYANNGRRAAG